MENESRQLAVSKGTIIFSEAEQLQKLFCIQDGVCKFSTIDDKGKERILQLLGKGELMGLKSIIMNKGAVITSTALPDTLLCSMEKKVVLNYMRKNNRFCMDIVKGFIRDIEHEESKKTLFLNYKNIQSRLASLLFYLNNKFGADRDGYLSVRLKREEMASLLGTSSEYIIKLIGGFKNKKYIALGQKGIKILSRQKLKTLISGSPKKLQVPFFL